MEPFATGLVLAAAGGLLATAALLSPVSHRLGVPALLIILGLGMLAGSEGIGGIPFEDYGLAYRAGTIALVLILFDGGLATPEQVFRRSVGRASVLATVGVVVTALVVAASGMALGLSPALALVLGAVVSSTDAAAVFAVLRGSRVRLKERTGGTLEVESGLNDPVAMLLTIVTTEMALGHRYLGAELVALAVMQLAFGALVGALFGYGGRTLMRLVPLPAPGLYPAATLAIALAAYGVATIANGSGFLAVYVAGVILAAGPLPYRAGVRRVHDALAWLSQLAMFLLLGLLVFPSRLWASAAPGVLLAVTLALIARPIGVLVSLLPFRLSWRERVFIAWVGLRGAVPVVLATYPVLRGVPEGDMLFHLVFFVVLVNSIVPGATVARLAQRFHLAAPTPPTPPAAVELVSLREYAGEFVWYTVARASAVAGATVQELPLPDGCVLTLLLRDDMVVAPRGDTAFREGDHVCVFVMRGDRGFLDLVFGRGDEDAE